MTQNKEDFMFGQTDPEFGRIVHDYLKNFSYYKVRKEWAVRDELYLWCKDNLGQQYKDWFVNEGGTYDKWWTVNIRSPKHGTLFALRWNDIIIESVDRRSQS